MDEIFGVPNVERINNDRESSLRRASGGYGDDLKPEIEQHEFSAERKSEGTPR
ncbi:hypothetical protein FRC08_009010 [Ceratobasidium sp. 394]|nr:hypothetical protein FRC08_009010 [Ceratobasidium sp. 394]